jgi:hypothetical protein
MVSRVGFYYTGIVRGEGSKSPPIGASLQVYWQKRLTFTCVALVTLSVCGHCVGRQMVGPGLDKYVFFTGNYVCSFKENKLFEKAARQFLFLLGVVFCNHSNMPRVCSVASQQACIITSQHYQLVFPVQCFSFKRRRFFSGF